MSRWYGTRQFWTKLSSKFFFKLVVIKFFKSFITKYFQIKDSEVDILCETDVMKVLVKKEFFTDLTRLQLNDPTCNMFTQNLVSEKFLKYIILFYLVLNFNKYIINFRLIMMILILSLKPDQTTVELLQKSSIQISFLLTPYMIISQKPKMSSVDPGSELIQS